MTEPFRDRRFVAVGPEDRPHRQRRAVRVLVTDGRSILLFADTDPGLPGSRWWVTPGGGIDPGETELAAAVRELAEETGRLVDPADLAGPILTRLVTHGYSDQVLHQHETFYLLRVSQPFAVDTAHHTPDEQLTLDGWAWHRLADLGRLPEPLWPVTLPELLVLAERPELWPVAAGEVEESTVRV